MEILCDPDIVNATERPHFCVGSELVVDSTMHSEWFAPETFVPTALAERIGRIRKSKRNPAIAHLAALNDNAEVFRAHPNPARVALLRDAGGLYPLHYAAFAGNVSTCRTLVDIMGGVEKAMNAKSKAGHTALHSAARGGHLELVQLFMSKATNDTERAKLVMLPATRHDYSVLDCAIAADAVDVVGYLMREPLLAAERSPENRWVELVLYRALQIDSIAVVRDTIARLGNIRGEETDVIVAALQKLICMGKQPCWPFGDVANYLRLGGKWEVLPSGPMMYVNNKSLYVKLLRNANPDGHVNVDEVVPEMREVVRAQDRDGKTLLHLLMEAGYTTMAKRQEMSLLQQACIALFADVHAVDARGMSVAHIAAMRGKFLVSDAVCRRLNFLRPPATSTLASPLQIMIATGHQMTTWKRVLFQCQSVQETFNVLSKPFAYGARWGTPMEWLSHRGCGGLVRELREIFQDFGIPVDAGSNPGDEWLVIGSRQPSRRWIRRWPHPVSAFPVCSARVLYSASGTVIDGPAVDLVMEGASAHSKGRAGYRTPRTCPFQQLKPAMLAAVLQRDASIATRETVL